MSAPEAAAPAPLGSGRRILVVDDNEAARRGLSKHLEALGFEVAVAPNGQDALEALRSGADFDFLLTDLLLPDIDGLEVSRAARELPHPPRTALITGWELDHDLAYYTSAGIDWVFLKPLQVQVLIARLLSSASVEPRSSPGSEAAPEPGD